MTQQAQAQAQAEVRDIDYWIAHTSDNPTAKLIQSLHARVQELEAQQAAVQGWKLVPMNPPEEMARAFRAEDAPAYFVMTTIRCADFAERYAAMLSAAPTPPAQERKPLTDEQIDALWGGENVSVPQLVNRRAISRSIERAHGIGATNG